MKEEEYNPKLADKGWNAMRQMLDREMPVGRRRGFAWWSWAALLLLFAGSGLVWKQGRRIQAPASHNAPEQAAPATPPAAQPIAGNPASASPDVSSSSQYKSENLQVANTAAGNDRAPGADGLSTQSGVRSVAGRRQNLRAESATKTPELMEKRVKAKALPASESAIRIAELAPAGTETGVSAQSGPPDAGSVATQAANPGVLPATSPEMPLVSTPEVDAQSAQMSLLTLPEMESLKTAALQHNLAYSAQTPVIKPLKQKHDRFAFGPNAGISTEHFRAVNAFSTGLTFDWQPFRRWGLRSGVQYGRQNISPVNRPVISIDAYQYVSTTMDFRFYPGNNSQSADPLAGFGSQAYYAGKSIIVPISVLYRVDVPLLLYGELYQKVRFYAGVSFSRLIGVGAYDQVLSYDNRVLQVRNQSAVNTLVKAKSSRNAAFYQFALGRRFGKHWDATVQYEGRFTDANQISVRQENSLTSGNTPTPGKATNNFDNISNSSTAKFFENSPLQLFNLKIAYLF